MEGLSQGRPVGKTSESEARCPSESLDRFTAPPQHYRGWFPSSRRGQNGGSEARRAGTPSSQPQPVRGIGSVFAPCRVHSYPSPTPSPALLLPSWSMEHISGEAAEREGP